MVSTQLLINLSPQPENTFETFVAEDNGHIVAHLHTLCGRETDYSSPQLVYLSGSPACGKTHLLQAICHRLRQRERATIYLPMKNVLDYGTELINGLEAMDLICLDDVDVLAGQPVWEEALFNLINRIRSDRGCLVASGSASPRQTPFSLPDLSSRLMWGGVYGLAPLSDQAKSQAIQLRVASKGNELSAEVSSWLLAHYSRDLRDLMQAVTKLSEVSLAKHRRITVPFARAVLVDEQAKL